MALRRVGHAPGSAAEADWHDTLGRAFQAVAGKVCTVCGLGGVGHAPQSEWLGYAAHKFDGVPATPDQLAHADTLTIAAYRARRENGTHTYCGHRYAGPACKRGDCIHIGGHCEHCD
jgi:hypothetical protein